MTDSPTTSPDDQAKEIEKLYANLNSDNQNEVYEEQTVGEGKYKVVKKGDYDNGKPCVAKFLKSGTTSSSDCFLDDVKNAKAALPYIGEFHEYVRKSLPQYAGKFSIKVNVPSVWTQTNEGPNKGQRFLVEPYVSNFEKFNSNSGAADASAEVAQALSHFSYHLSDGRELLCDLQGGRSGNDYVLSDVVLMSAEKKYGNTDLGLPGIENFCAHHVCGPFCSREWKTWSNARRRYQPVMSTTITLDVANIPTPLSNREYTRVFASDINFTQDSIKASFQDGKSLLSTALELARKDIEKNDIPMITVVRKDGKMWSLDNRRLAVFRLLEIAGKIRKIKIEIVPFSEREDEFSRKYDGGNGESILVRQGSHVIIGRTADSTHFPGLDEIRDTFPTEKPEDAMLTMFLGTLTDDH
ncbi:unnamed protein product [Amoebophrya sp. A25]|nr:unnamed protein product [Amoebophrya sp. A25]|eukprot:GSA25T00018348001.1